MGRKSERVTIGQYDPGLPPKSLTPTGDRYSYLAAVRAAERMAIAHHAHRAEGGRPALVAAERLAKEQADAVKLDAANHTLRALLKDYCDRLEAMGRISHRACRSIFKVHVIEPWPQLADKPANHITAEEVADMMRKTIGKGKGRTANKLRSYLRAAFQMAMAAKSKPSIPAKFKAYGVTHNPAAATEPDETQNRADKKPLSLVEMQTYWKAIRTMPGLCGSILRLHLLTGGQRIEQLMRLRTADIDRDSIILYDGKGRPGREARQHRVPLLPRAESSLLECKPNGVYALSRNDGAGHISSSTLSAWAAKAAAGIKDFNAKRIRSGVETVLASAGVPKEIRGRLQSHGISGVQDRHYDGHDYMPEKRAAVVQLLRLLEGTKQAQPSGTRARRN